MWQVVGYITEYNGEKTERRVIEYFSVKNLMDWAERDLPLLFDDVTLGSQGFIFRNSCFLFNK